MGLEIQVNSLDDLCELMCNNTIPSKKKTKTIEYKGYIIEKCGVGYNVNIDYTNNYYDSINQAKSDIDNYVNQK